ncbi:MAG: tetratricopeptide repeat protein [Spirochaetes bacterium]|nr:tetratricopeptide repeat protein [Spirochaetota bacterium]
MKSRININIIRVVNIFVIILLFLALNSCSGDKPVLKKKLSECSARDVLEYGRALFNAEYYDDAIEEYKRVIAHFPNDKKESSWAQYELAYSYYYMEDYEEALDEFKKVNMLYPDQRGPVILARKMITQITVLLY